MVGALEGVRIIDLTVMQQGPAATGLLAEMGADVIKIEHPVHGDPGRSSMGQRHKVNGKTIYPNSYFDSFNRSKRSIKLDLSTDAGREVLYKLVGVSQVFVTNYRVGVPEKLGVDYATLKTYNPSIIFAHATGYGLKGSDAKQPSVDSVATVRAGFPSLLGEPGQPPIWADAITDQVGAAILACGILAALYQRAITGRGQLVSTSLLGSAIWLQTVRMNEYLFSGFPTEKKSQKTRGFPNVYLCKDDKWLMLNLASSVERGIWSRLCHILGKPEWAEDPVWSTVDGRLDNAAEITERVGEVIRQRTRDEWLAIAAGLGDLRGARPRAVRGRLRPTSSRERVHRRFAHSESWHGEDGWAPHPPQRDTPGVQGRRPRVGPANRGGPHGYPGLHVEGNRRAPGRRGYLASRPDDLLHSRTLPGP